MSDLSFQIDKIYSQARAFLITILNRSTLVQVQCFKEECV